MKPIFVNGDKMTKIEIKYPKRKNKENMHDDWMMRVSYKNKYPTREEIDADYVTLPIPNEFWLKMNMPDEEYKTAILDAIFNIMNRYDTNPMGMTSESDEHGKRMQQWLRNHDIRHTSMSVGDVIILDNNIYVCDVQGWKEVQ